MAKKRFNTQVILFGVCLLIYVVGVSGYIYWYNSHSKRNLMNVIDEKLLLAAKSLKYMVAPDFHDRTQDENSISFEEELQNRVAISGYTFETEFEWLYTLIEKNGRYYFSAPTVTAEEAKERKRCYYLPYPDVPSEFVRAYEENQPVYTVYQDRWGMFRSIALPQVSPNGRRYLACGDYDIGFIDALIKKNLKLSLLTTCFFLLLTFPFIIAFVLHNRELRQSNQQLRDYRDSLEVKVKNRTRELEKEKVNAEQLVDQLESALMNVKKLEGLLPICSCCKKIRDANGNWNQIEVYIRDHSQVEFSHSLCPTCAQQYYPEV